ISVLKRAIHCLGCGVCLGRCPVGALSLEDLGGREKVRVDEELCIVCRKCLGPCPVENFGAGEKYRFTGLSNS
ncbi:MAG: 4Fe-4S dicluster domain-containing protein, partial [Candidatus Thermoplasmatota archaeon]|nr:4Fe-4S dicluster domain-containing protein [Candidatus Thermoplasmatota archaeon]